MIQSDEGTLYKMFKYLNKGQDNATAEDCSP